MRRTVLGLTFLLLSSASASAADVSIEIRFDAPPPLVIVSPGIQVVPDHADEIYFVDSWYWVRRDGRWWRTHDHSGNWVVVVAGNVPPGLSKIPPGKYKKYKPAKASNGGSSKSGNGSSNRNGNKGKGNGNGKGKGK